MLGVTLADAFTVTEHVQDLTAMSAQTLYVLRVLRAHGLSDAALQEVARLLYAASAWHGFAKAADRRRINLLFERANVTAIVFQTCQLLKNCVTPQMINCLQF